MINMLKRLKKHLPQIERQKWKDNNLFQHMVVVDVGEEHHHRLQFLLKLFKLYLRGLMVFKDVVDEHSNRLVAIQDQINMLVAKFDNFTHQP